MSHFLFEIGKVLFYFKLHCFIKFIKSRVDKKNDKLCDSSLIAKFTVNNIFAITNADFCTDVPLGCQELR